MTAGEVVWKKTGSPPLLVLAVGGDWVAGDKSACEVPAGIVMARWDGPRGTEHGLFKEEELTKEKTPLGGERC